MKCKLFTCNDHDGFWPVGAASVIIAKEIDHAYDLLNGALERHGLQSYDNAPYTLVRVDDVKIKTKNPRVIILLDGNY